MEKGLPLHEPGVDSELPTADSAYLGPVKNPVDYLTTTLRSLGATLNPKATGVTLNNMGYHSSVFGWLTEKHEAEQVQYISLSELSRVNAVCL